MECLLTLTNIIKISMRMVAKKSYYHYSESYIKMFKEAKKNKCILQKTNKI